jgi:chromosome partitioning protein
MITLTIANQKGGVGKTTTATILAHYFSRLGLRTLLVDLDGQGHAARALGLEKGNGLYSLLVLNCPLPEAVTLARPGGNGGAPLHLVSNDHNAERVKAHVAGAMMREFILAEALASANYDLVILDTPPSTDVLHISALVAAEYLIIPSLMDDLALDGVGAILTTTRALGRFAGVTPPALIGVLPTMYEKVTGETQANVQALTRSVGADAILPPIPRDTKIREASAAGQTVWEYAPTCQAAIGYVNGSKVTNSQGRTGGYLHTAEIAARMMGFHLTPDRRGEAEKGGRNGR